MKRVGSLTTLQPAWFSRRRSRRSGSRMPSPLAFRASMASTRPSYPCWPTRSSAPAASWCSGPTPHWRPSFWASRLRSPTGDVNRAVALAGMMAIVSGAVCILAGVARLGFVTELLSKPIRYGYMNGIALAVLVSQTPKLFGVKVEKAGPLRDIWSIAVEIAGGRVNWTEFALGAATLAVIFSIKTFKGLPGILLAVVGATVIVQVFDLEREPMSLCSVPFRSGCPRFPYRGSAFRI